MGTQSKPNQTKGAKAIWISGGLKLQEAQLILGKDIQRLGLHVTELQKLTLARRADRLSSDISRFLAEGRAYIGSAVEDPFSDEDGQPEESETIHIEVDAEELPDELGGQRPDQVEIPLPSTIGRKRCRERGLDDLCDMELKLRTGQANDALHEIRLLLAEKSVLFRTSVRHASNHAKATRSWDKVHSVDQTIDRYATIYRQCREAMIRLDADVETLARYKELRHEELKANTSAMRPNDRGLRYEQLPWFWNMDVPRDIQSSGWMSECESFSGPNSILTISSQCSLSCSLATCKGHDGQVGRGGTVAHGRVPMDHWLFQAPHGQLGS